LVVSIGEIHFVLEDGRENSASFKVTNEFTLSEENYGRLTIPPGIWMKFSGIGATNSLLNLADMPHDPLESIQR
jgi:dTDP-4-dehydrorhamnose 3,5-epimerase